MFYFVLHSVCTNFANMKGTIATLLFLLLPLVTVGQTDDVIKEDTLEELTVTSRSAQRRIEEVQVGVEKIDIGTMAKVPALFGERDIIKNLQLLPGVKSESDGSSGYQVRGGTSAQNLILLDGATIYNAGHLMGLFSAFNDNALSNASLYKGMVPAQYGGGTSSVFDISTRPGDNEHHHFKGSIGLLSAQLTAEGPLHKGASSYLAAFRRSYIDIFLKSTKKYKDNTLNFYDANIQLNFSMGVRDRLSFSFYRGRDNMGIEDLMDLSWGNTSANAHWLHTSNDHLYLNTALTFSDFRNDTGIDMLNIYYQMKGFISHLTLHHDETWTPSRTFNLKYGLESTYLQLQSAEWDVNLLHQREKRDAWVNAIWVQQEWKATRRLTVSAGLRLHLFSVLGGAPYYELDAQGGIINTLHPGRGSIVKTYANLEPRFSTHFRINKHQSVKVGYSRTTQDIHAIRGSSMSMPFDRYTMTSNLLSPEQADQVALGWNGITPTKKYDFSAEAYYKVTKNVYDYRDGKSFHSEIEIERLLLGGKGRSYGLELSAHKNSGRLTGWASYTLSWSENKIAGISNGQWYTASNDRRHDLCLVGIYQATPRWELSALWRYTTGQALTVPSAKYEIGGTTFYYYAERNGYRSPAYHRLDLSATYTRQLRRTKHIWAFGIYNAYCRYNPFVVRFENDNESPTGTKATLTALFGIVPSVSFTIQY